MASQEKAAFYFFSSVIETFHSVFGDIQTKYNLLQAEDNSNEDKMQILLEIRRCISIYYDLLRIIESCVNIIPEAALSEKGLCFLQISNLCFIVIRDCIDGMMLTILNKINDGSGIGIIIISVQGRTAVNGIVPSVGNILHSQPKKKGI